MDAREHWMEIEAFPRYLVSDQGRVQNVVTGRILKPQMSGRDIKQGNGYLQVYLCTGHGCIQNRVHRLVASTFIGIIPEGFTVNHIDGIKINNVVDNLEIVSYSDNNRHAFETGLKLPTYAFKRVRCIETGETFNSVNEAAERFGTFAQLISAVIHGRQRTTRGLHFELVD